MNVLVTGGAGFIGSNVVRALNARGIVPMVGEKPWSTIHKNDKWKNLYGLKFKVDSYCAEAALADVVIHMGAVTDTTPEKDVADAMFYDNYQDTVSLFHRCKRIIYASSAAVYGNGKGPLNYYGYLKLLADEYLLNMTNKPSQWVGLRFFNVYGPGEQHKGKMASMIYQAYCQLKETGKVKLFKDGTQRRDFVHVNDVVSVIMWMIDHPSVNGIFDVGSGTSIDFVNVAKTVAECMDMEYGDVIDFIDMPDNIKDKFQVNTLADSFKLIDAGCCLSRIPYYNGITSYIKWLQNR